MTKISLLIILIYSSAASAQVGINISGTLGTSNSKNWKKFAHSYQELYQDQLSKSKLKMGFAYGTSLGIDLNAGSAAGELFENFYLGFRYVHLNSSASASFKDGSERNYDLKERLAYVPVGMQFGNDLGSALISLGIGLSYGELISSYTYPDGTSSIGSDKRLNGVFSSSYFVFIPQFTYTIHLPGDKFPLVSVFMEFGYRFSSPVLGSFADKIYQESGFIDLTNDVPSAGFPSDAAAFFNDPNSAPYSGDVVNKFSGILLNIGLKIGIKP